LKIVVQPSLVEYGKIALGGRRAIQLCHGDFVFNSLECVRKNIQNFQQKFLVSGVYSEGLFSAISGMQNPENLRELTMPLLKSF